MRNFGPKRSTSQPCSGASQVWSTIRTENVIWIAGRLAPVAAWNGATNKVQTYCGLEIDIMAINPRASWTHLVAGKAAAASRGSVADASLANDIGVPLDQWLASPELM